MRLLWITGTLDPATGGPVEALRQLTNALQSLGHDCEVVTLDGPPDPGMGRFPALVHTLGPSRGKYRFNRALIGWLCENAPRFDAVLVSGIWQYPSFATWVASRRVNFPYFVFVHGALDPWFKRTYPLKHLKKWLYWPWADYPALRDATGVFYTSAEEMVLAPKSFWLYKANPYVIPFGIKRPQGDPQAERKLFLEKFPALHGKRLILSLGRIHPKKGGDLLLSAFARVAAQDANLHLVMAGPDSDGYRSELEGLAFRLGLAERVAWTGMLSGDVKWGAFRAADVFMLPSHSENFGVAVVEALACNLPVLITDKVNIWREIKEDGAGLVDTDTGEGALRLMQEWLSLGASERDEMRERAGRCFLQRFDLDSVGTQFVEIIRSAIEGQSVPGGRRYPHPWEMKGK